MTDRRQINVKIKSNRAESWEDAVREHPEYSSMTDLIRQAVSKELTSGPDSSSADISPEIGRDIAEIKDNMNEMDQDISMLTDTISRLRDQLRNNNPSDKHLRAEVFAALPPKNTIEAKTPEEIAGELGEPISEDIVTRVLQNLSEDVGSVKRHVEANGEMSYTKKSDNGI